MAILIANGGDALYLARWMRESGLADLLPSLPPSGGGEALGLVDFSIFPHVDHEQMPGNSMDHAEQWAAKLPVPWYAIEDETAVKVVDARAGAPRRPARRLVAGGGADRVWAFSEFHHPRLRGRCHDRRRQRLRRKPDRDPATTGRRHDHDAMVVADRGQQ